MAAALAAPAAPAAAGNCGGLLQPACPPPPPYPPSPDPGGDENAALSVPPPGGKLFGFNTNLWWQRPNGADLVPFEVYRSARAGARVIRTTINWYAFATGPSTPLGQDAVEHPERGTVPGDSALERLDELYDTAAAAGLSLDFVINGAPKWASAYASCTPFLGLYSSSCQPVAQNKRLYPTGSHLGDLANFVTALGRRYPGVVFETWNEPNFDRGPQAAGGGFVGQMQCAVWQAAKALPQPSLVLSAAFGDFYGEDATRSYMRAFYSAGASCFDRLSIHTYNGNVGSFGANSPLAGHMKIARDARTEAGDSRPVWVTEFGFTTASNSKAVSEAQQADLTRREYNKLLTMPDVEAAFVHTLRDAPLPQYTSRYDTDYGFGWLHRDGSPKPVFCDFSRLAGTPACA